MHRSTSARLGAVFAASAAIFAFASGPAMAAPGANGSCPGGTFCPSSTVGDPSGNGAPGQGNAYGKPAQATAGSSEINPADFKNPPGQYENDNNNGYECDGNNGIDWGNPAHSSCDTYTPSS